MRKFTVTSKDFPKFTVLAHSMTGAIAKAETVGEKLYGARIHRVELTVTVAR